MEIKYLDKSNFQNEGEKQLFKDLLEMYNSENTKVVKDIDGIRMKIKKVDFEIKLKTAELNLITPKYEEYKTAFETNSQKLEILKDAKNLLKRDIFVKRQESKVTFIA